MPIKDGVLYPELYIHPIPNPILRVMLLTAESAYLYNLMKKLRVLMHYLSDIDVDFKIEVKVLKTKSLDDNKDKYGYEVFEDPGGDAKSILSYACSNNVDVIYSDDINLITELYKLDKPFQYASSSDQLESEIQAFVTGKNVVWDFEHPLWNGTFLSKYVEIEPLMSNLRSLYNAMTTSLEYSSDQINFVRALQHKAMQVRYCEEIILSLIQKKHFSERNYTLKNSYGYDDFYDYSFEINYHLGNFYFLLSGTFDIIGRLLANLYSIHEVDVKPNIEHIKFLEQLKTKNVRLFNLYSEKDMNEWMVWIKRKRNYVAHESEASYSDVVRAKATQLSDGEIEAKVNAMNDWDALRVTFGGVYVESQKEAARSVVRAHENHEIITKNAMRVNYFDTEKRKPALAIFHPLVDIKADYDKYQQLINTTAKLLLGPTSA